MFLGLDVPTCDQSKANLFNKQFYSVFTRGHNSESTTPTVEDSSDSVLSDIIITSSEVYKTSSNKVSVFINSY